MADVKKVTYKRSVNILARFLPLQNIFCYIHIRFLGVSDDV